MRHVDALKGQFRLALNLPGSKSITLRDAVLASLAQGLSLLEFPAKCNDFSRISDALTKLGVRVWQTNAESISIAGTGGNFHVGPVVLHAGLSGTATRFLIALGLLRCDETIIDGLPPLRARPNKDLVEAVASLGAEVCSPNGGHLPISVRGPKVCKQSVCIKGDRSSQYLSGLLLVGPLLPGGLGLDIEVNGELVSKPYIDITLREMLRFGVAVERDGYRRFRVQPQAYQPAVIRIEGDASSASYHAALATIHGGTVIFNNLGKKSTRVTIGS